MSLERLDARPVGERGNTILEAEATVTRIGGRIRELRAERDLTLQSLAQRTGLSSSMLSLVERGKTSPSIGTLVAISSALGVHMSDLVDDRLEVQTDPVSRREDQQLYVTAEGVQHRVLKTDDSHAMELGFNEYEPGTGSGSTPVHHSGYEYGIVIEGELTVEVDGEAYRLKPGDCISYDSNKPHRIFNDGRKHASAVWVNLGR